MVSCLLFKNTLLSREEIKEIVTEFVSEENLNISSEHNLVVVYLEGISRAKLWQLVLNFEMKKPILGYGIDEDKHQSRMKALKRLNEVENAM